MSLFWRKGFAETSLVDLENTLQVKAPSIYATFGSKHKLFLEAINHYIRVVVDARVRVHLSGATDPIEGIRNFLISGLGSPDEDLPGMGCLLTNSAAEFGSTDQEIAARIKRGLARTQEAFEAALKEQINDEPRVKRMAVNLLVDFQGLMLLSKLQYNRESLLIAIDRIVDHLR